MFLTSVIFKYDLLFLSNKNRLQECEFRCHDRCLRNLKSASPNNKIVNLCLIAVDESGHYVKGRRL